VCVCVCACLVVSLSIVKVPGHHWGPWCKEHSEVINNGEKHCALWILVSIGSDFYIF
jgi:hypothetical protein